MKCLIDSSCGVWSLLAVDLEEASIPRGAKVSAAAAAAVPEPVAQFCACRSRHTAKHFSALQRSSDLKWNASHMCSPAAAH